MENLDFESASKFVESWEKSSLGRVLGLLAALAEREVARSAPLVTQSAATACDPLYKPQQAARYFAVSWKTFRDDYCPRYSIKSTGTGRNRRFALSELNRVKAIREEQAQYGKSVSNRGQVAN